MPDGSFSALLTDPPYTTAGGSSNGRSAGNVVDSLFFRYWLSAVFAEVRRVVRPDGAGFVFCDWRSLAEIVAAMSPSGSRQTEEAWRVGQALVWDRESIGLGSPFRNSFEMIAFVRGPLYRSELPKNLPTVIRHRYPYGSHEHHGAQKPVGLVRTLLGWLPPGAVLDPFVGSGTTLVAARDTGRDATGIELDPDTHDTAASRVGLPVSEATRRNRLLRQKCPDCGSDVEWHLRSSREGDSSAAHCIWSGRAYLDGQLAVDFEDGRRCKWQGRIVRAMGGTTRLETVAS